MERTFNTVAQTTDRVLEQHARFDHQIQITVVSASMNAAMHARLEGTIILATNARCLPTCIASVTVTLKCLRLPPQTKIVQRVSLVLFTIVPVRACVMVFQWVVPTLVRFTESVQS